MTDPDTLSAHARRLFDPSGWKERTYGDPTVRVLILPGTDAQLRELHCPGGEFTRFKGELFLGLLSTLCRWCGARACHHLGRWGSLLPLPPLPRSVAEVADAVLAYEARLAALASPGPTNLFLPGPGGEFRPRRIS